MVSLSVYQDCIFHRTAGSPPGVFSCTREKLLGPMIRWTETTDEHGSDSVVGTESVMDLHQQLFSSKATPKKPCVSVTSHTPICSFIFLHFWIAWHHVLNAFLENLMTVLSRHSPTCLKYTISFISWQFHTSTVFFHTSTSSPGYFQVHLTSHSSQLCVSFLFQHKPSSPICAPHMLLGVGPSTGLWSRQRKLGLHPLKATN